MQAITEKINFGATGSALYDFYAASRAFVKKYPGTLTVPCLLTAIGGFAYCTGPLGLSALLTVGGIGAYANSFKTLSLKDCLLSIPPMGGGALMGIVTATSLYAPPSETVRIAEIKAATQIVNGKTQAEQCESYRSAFLELFGYRIEASYFSWKGVERQYCVNMEFFKRDNDKLVVVINPNSNEPKVKKFPLPLPPLAVSQP